MEMNRDRVTAAMWGWDVLQGVSCQLSSMGDKQK